MTKIQNILAIVNPNTIGSAAASRGSALASKLGAHLTLLSVVYESAASFDLFHFLSEDHVRNRMQIDAQINLESLASSLELPADQLSIKVHWGRSFDQHVRDFSESTQADLVCISPRDEHSKTLSHAEWRLIHGSRVPVLLAKKRPWSDPAIVTAGVDVGAEDRESSGINQQIVQIATTIAAQFGKFEVFHATHDTPDAIGITQDPNEPGTRLLEHRKELLLSLLPSAVQEATAVHVAAQDANIAIADFCRERPVDLMVMGVSAKNRVSEFLIGSTARTLLPTLPCDVLAMPFGR